MQRLKTALEALDEMISDLEDKIGLNTRAQREAYKKQQETLRQAQTREAGLLATSQKIATRLDQTIRHVEQVLKD